MPSCSQASLSTDLTHRPCLAAACRHARGRRGTGAEIASICDDVLPRSTNIRRLTALVTLSGLSCTPAIAEPVFLEQARDEASGFATPAPHEEAHDVHAWIHRETTTAMLDGVSERGRQQLLLQGWQARAPTWIQSAATVNLGDFPGLDDPTATAERDLQTLQWVLEDQRRQAAGRAVQRGADTPAAPEDNWWRQLLPRHWVPVLKANREWVAAGGTTLLVIVWAMAAFARRPGAPPSVEPPQTRPPPVRRRRRHRSTGSHGGTRPAALSETPRARG